MMAKTLKAYLENNVRVWSHDPYRVESSHGFTLNTLHKLLGEQAQLTQTLGEENFF
jgi:hypothetical protein